MASSNEGQLLNMLRHEYTNYHDVLQELGGRVGCWDAYRVIKERVNGEVAVRLRRGRCSFDGAILALLSRKSQDNV